jgi:hypothetical protein
MDAIYSSRLLRSERERQAMRLPAERPNGDDDLHINFEDVPRLTNEQLTS